MNQPDIIFISYNESNADKNWVELKSRFPGAKRVHGVSGIANAHKQAAEKSSSEFFFVVDGDNRIKKDFDFSVEGLTLKENTLYVWRCHNPINDLIYGYGAVKLYNKKLLLNRVEGQYLDLATTVTEHYKIVPVVASETHFFHTKEEAWRGAFRESVKLSSEMILRQKNDETKQRLERWKVVNPSYKNSLWCLKGVNDGLAFSKRLKENEDLKSLINDFDWLKEQFRKIENEY